MLSIDREGRCTRGVNRGFALTDVGGAANIRIADHSEARKKT